MTFELSKIAPHHVQEWRSSGIDDTLIELNLATLCDTETSDGGNEARYPIAETLGWSVTRFGQKARLTQYGWRVNSYDIFTNTFCDYSQVKLDCPQIDHENYKIRKYESPCKARGESRAYLLFVSEIIWQKIADRYQTPVNDIDKAKNFWHWVHKNQLPIILTEGAKKAGSLLSQGYIAIALPGISMGYRHLRDKGGNQTGVRQLIPDLQHFATLDRRFYFCFDFDQKPETQQAVNINIKITGSLLVQSGCTVRVIDLPPGQEKGVDDFLVAKGEEAFAQLYEQAPDFYQWQADAFNQLSYSPQVSLSQRFLGPLPELPPGLIGIKSPKGTGKTESLKSLIWQHKRVLLIGHRVALLRNLSDRLELPLYSNSGINLSRVQNLAITIDSLGKLPTIFNQFDLVIIDEVEQVLDHLANSSTCKKFRERALLVFEYFCRKATRVIALDADLSDVAIDYLLTCREQQTNPFLIVNHFKDSGRQVNWFEGADPGGLIVTLLKEIAAHKRPYIFTDSKTEAKRLELFLQSLFPKKKIAVIHGDNSGEPDKALLVQHINQLAPQFDVLISTPSLGTGISIDVEHFDCVYGIAHGGSLSATQFSQGLFRVRASVPISVWVSTRVMRGYRETNAVRLRQNAVRAYKVSGVLLNIDRETGEETASNPNYLKLWSELNACKNYSLNYLRNSVRLQLQSEGHTIDVRETSQQPATKKQLQQAKETIRRLEAEAIASARDISRFDIECLDYRQRLTPEDRCAIEKYRIRTGYGMEVTPELVLKDQKGRLLTALSRLDLFQSDVEVCREEDLENRKQFQVITDVAHFLLKRNVRELMGLRALLDPEQEFSHQDLQGLGDFCRHHQRDIKFLFNLTISKQSSNGWIYAEIMHHLGLKTEFRRQGGRGQQQKFYRITAESWEFAQQVRSHWEQQRQQLIQQQLEATDNDVQPTLSPSTQPQDTQLQDAVPVVVAPPINNLDNGGDTTALTSSVSSPRHARPLPHGVKPPIAAKNALFIQSSFTFPTNQDFPPPRKVKTPPPRASP
jgi:hypothetical protein